MSMNPTATKAVQLARVRQLITYFEQGAIPRLAQHEVHPDLAKGSRENYLYFTLPVCINFQRSSPAMWQSALATYSDPETNYVFLPEKLAGKPSEHIRASLMRHKLALQPIKHTLIWTTIAITLHRYYHDDPREIIAEASHSAGTLIHNLQSTYRERFPYLGGRKLSNYWPYILMHYTDVQLTNNDAISIIPDTHVLQSSARLGLVSAGATAEQVEATWRALLAGTDISPMDMHPVLWNWSRNGFQPEV